MNIDSKGEIADCPTLGVRSFLRETMHCHSWDKLWLQNTLALSSQRAKLVLEQLSRDGYVEPSPFCNGEWRNTIKGNALACASAAKPLRRESAESKLDSFLSRVRQVNSPDCDFLYWIEEVVVFGSILTNKSRLSDIDISIRLAKKLEAKEFSVAADRRTRLAAANGRSFRNIVDEVYWPEREVLLFVKSRSRAISLIEWNSKWLQEQDHRVLYRRTDDSKMTMSADDQIEHCDGASKPALKARFGCGSSIRLCKSDLNYLAVFIR